MKLFMFTHWNKKLECSSQIVFDDHEPAVFKQAVLRACKEADLPKVKEAKKLTKLIWLGVYDDEAMKFEVCSEPEILIDFDELIAQREVLEEKLKEVAKNA